MGSRNEKVYTCDVTYQRLGPCGKELRTKEDGLILHGQLSVPNGEKEAFVMGPEYVICWSCFHRLFPSPEYRAYQDNIAQSYER